MTSLRWWFTRAAALSRRNARVDRATRRNTDVVFHDQASESPISLSFRDNGFRSSGRNCRGGAKGTKPSKNVTKSYLNRQNRQECVSEK